MYLHVNHSNLPNGCTTDVQKYSNNLNTRPYSNGQKSSSFLGIQGSPKTKLKNSTNIPKPDFISGFGMAGASEYSLLKVWCLGVQNSDHYCILNYFA